MQRSCTGCTVYVVLFTLWVNLSAGCVCVCLCVCGGWEHGEERRRGLRVKVSFLTLIVTKTIQGRRAIILRHLVNSVCACPSFYHCHQLFHSALPRAEIIIFLSFNRTSSLTIFAASSFSNVVACTFSSFPPSVALFCVTAQPRLSCLPLQFSDDPLVLLLPQHTSFESFCRMH